MFPHVLTWWSKGSDSIAWGAVSKRLFLGCMHCLRAINIIYCKCKFHYLPKENSIQKVYKLCQKIFCKKSCSTSPNFFLLLNGNIRHYKPYPFVLFLITLYLIAFRMWNATTDILVILLLIQDNTIR